MLKLFSGAGADTWPLAKILDVLRRQYGAVEHLGDEGAIRFYGVHDNGVNFVVALVQSVEGDDHVSEIGFLASFIGFSVDQTAVEMLNRNLHISVVDTENGALVLLAGVKATGPFHDGKFMLLLEAWRRDIAIVLYTLSGSASMADAFPAARLEAARRFASNFAPGGQEGDAAVGEFAAGAQARDMPASAAALFSAFIGGDSAKSLCGACGGKGRRGLITRTCGDCDGSGFISRPS